MSSKIFLGVMGVVSLIVVLGALGYRVWQLDSDVSRLITSSASGEKKAQELENAVVALPTRQELEIKMGGVEERVGKLGDSLEILEDKVDTGLDNRYTKEEVNVLENLVVQTIKDLDTLAASNRFVNERVTALEGPRDAQRFFARQQELFAPVASIRIQNLTTGEEMYATGFLQESERGLILRTSPHVATEVDGGLIGATRADVVFPFLPGDPAMFLTNPKFEKNGLAAYFELTDEMEQLLRRLNVVPYKGGDIRKLSPGDEVFRLSASRIRYRQHGSLVGITRVEFIDFKDSYLSLYVDPESRIVASPRYNKSVGEIFFAGMGVPNAILGDSGGPVLFYDRDLDEFVVIGVTELVAVAIKQE